MKTKIPPPIIGLTLILINFISIYFFSSNKFQFQGIISLIILIVGLLIVVAAVRLFAKHKTIVNPMTPKKTTSLVTEGVYGYSRNPMYVGLFLIIGSSSLYFGTWVGLITLLLFVIIINSLQIKPEEKAMRELFGDEYEVYMTKVRRWI